MFRRRKRRHPYLLCLHYRSIRRPRRAAGSTGAGAPAGSTGARCTATRSAGATRARAAPTSPPYQRAQSYPRSRPNPRYRCCHQNIRRQRPDPRGTNKKNRRGSTSSLDMPARWLPWLSQMEGTAVPPRQRGLPEQRTTPRQALGRPMLFRVVVLRYGRHAGRAARPTAASRT